MDLATRKYNFIEQLATVDEPLLLQLEFLLKSSKEDWFNELSKEEREDIKKGLQDANHNKFVSHEQAMNAFSKWKKK